jgi:hypothetical protein
LEFLAPAARRKTSGGSIHPGAKPITGRGEGRSLGLNLVFPQVGGIDPLLGGSDPVNDRRLSALSNIA